MVRFRLFLPYVGIQDETEKELRQAIVSLNTLSELLKRKKSKQLQLTTLQSSSNRCQSQIKIGKARLNTIRIEKKITIEKKNSLIGKMFGFLSKQIDYEKELEIILNKEIPLQSDLEKKGKRLSGYLNEIKELNLNVKKIDAKINLDLSHLEETGAIEDTKPSSLGRSLDELHKRLEKKLDDNQVYKSLSKEYQNLANPQLEILLREFCSEKEKLENYSTETRIESAQVIGATIDTYLHRFKEKRANVAHIFIDEAGYASIVKALTVFTSKTPVTFLGDHKQLPPVCEIKKSDIKKDKDISEVFVWDQSAIYIGDLWTAKNLDAALQKYFTSIKPSYVDFPKSTLTESFRFGPNLAKVLDKYVYEEGFNSQVDQDTELIICNVSNPQSSRGRGRLNEAEALAIQDLVIKNFKVKDSVAILAPYNDQIKTLKKLLPDFKDENKILTVHKSQGREWDTVIYSVCDIGNGRRPWFTDTISTISNGLNNVNTAVSRAKKRLIICCSYDEWINRNNQLIKGLLEASTHRIDYDSSQFTFSINSNHELDINRSKDQMFKSNIESVTPDTKIKNKNYLPIKPDEEWESQTLYWSKLKKPEYSYAASKDAWWKKK